MVVKKKKKKGSKKKKKLQAGEGPDHDDADGVQTEPGTLISGSTQTSPEPKKSGAGKKKKVKKKKLSKAEKAQEKLNNNMDKIRKEPDIFNNYIDRMDRWIRMNYPRALQIFKKIDTEGEGLVSYDLFKSGMFDLNIPLNKIELHLLATLLDGENSGEIDYTQLGEGLIHVRNNPDFDEDEEEDGEEEVDGEKEMEKDGDAGNRVVIKTEKLKLIPTERNFNHCVCCKMSICEPYREKNPKYLHIELRLVTFDKLKRHPGHIHLLVHSHLPVFGLVELITKLTSLQSTKVAVFKNKSRTKDARLPSENRLEDCGYPGDIRDDPQKILLYYDYTVEFTDCPILMCDHYFGQKLPQQKL